MITKFKTINNLAVFQNFVWDTSVTRSNHIEVFKPINILFGRNYSGKTTLSRIIRALEKGVISDKYENPQFEVEFTDNRNASQSDLVTHGKTIRVFNEDFVKDNLKFIVNSNESITPFAIIGGNANIETEIQILKNQLGNNEEGIESGFYLELKNAQIFENTAYEAYRQEKSLLDQQLSTKALDRTTGIKYRSDKFGDQNYTTSKLVSDIDIVLKSDFRPISEDEEAQKVLLLKEKANVDIPPIAKPNIELGDFNSKARTLVTKSISNSDKIEQLLKDAILNRWIKEGRHLHKTKADHCLFCGNKISENRWNEIDSHFDEESEKLEREIDVLISEGDNLILSVDAQLQINPSLFYSSFHLDLNRLISLRQIIANNIKDEISRIKLSLQTRKENLLHPGNYTDLVDNSQRLDWCWAIFESLRAQANEYSHSLGNDQNVAKRLLRLKEVYDFVNTVQYSSVLEKINSLKKTLDDAANNKQAVEYKIATQLTHIAGKERLMNDEEKGALKVNEYLNNFFGHDFLSLEALEEHDKKIRFEIVRNGVKAHHLSEGECSLIAFCYFMAKLEDVETKGYKPIIWIDDPISSLDSNHIFFVHSLINAEIIAKKEFEQIFISTHNLDFLKYLKRLHSKEERGFFLVSRDKEVSKIKLMPKYLKDYVTEFNFLFHQIYMCSTADADDESQHGLYYNFGNNTRKFLEAFLYYKYPSAADQTEKLTKFFGDNRQASTMTDRINNEFSHLEGLFERSMNPIDIPEMKKTATFLLEKIREKDNEQYEALLLSIGVSMTQA